MLEGVQISPSTGSGQALGAPAPGRRPPLGIGGSLDEDPAAATAGVDGDQSAMGIQGAVYYEDLTVGPTASSGAVWHGESPPLANWP
ncbi:MAG: hypothetical protein ACE5JL_13530, partial [Dehalococcoidia bacterium]